MPTEIPQPPGPNEPGRPNLSVFGPLENRRFDAPPRFLEPSRRDFDRGIGFVIDIHDTRETRQRRRRTNMAIAGLTSIGLFLLGPTVYFATDHPSRHASDHTSSDTSSGVNNPGQSGLYEIGQSTEAADNLSVQAFSQQFARLINEAVENRRTVTNDDKSRLRLSSSLVPTSSAVGGTNPRYELFFDAQLQRDGSPDFRSTTTAGVNATVDRVENDKTVADDVTVFTIDQVVADANEYWSITVGSLDNNGQEVTTEYTTDPRVAADPDSFAVFPHSLGATPYTRRLLTVGLLEDLQVKGMNYLQTAMDGAPIYPVNLQAAA